VNRENAVEVIRRIMVSCGSFDTTQAVLTRDKKTRSWVLTLLGFLCLKKNET
jgi:hypothetical protein